MDFASFMKIIQSICGFDFEAGSGFALGLGMRMDKLVAWLGWLGQVVRGCVASAAYSRAKAGKSQDSACDKG
jgi:hypothetical protein